MDWLFGKKKEEPKDKNAVVITLDTKNLPKLAALDPSKFPEKPKFKTR